MRATERSRYKSGAWFCAADVQAQLRCLNAEPACAEAVEDLGYVRAAAPRGGRAAKRSAALART